MPKNIVLFSDGTGNKGGTGPATNVFKLYHGVKLCDENHDARGNITQRIFYDNGVGTSSHAVLRAIGGATGFEFKWNVRDLYEFVGRHYTNDDDIYAFGFSRGAATVRAFAGMLECCGLVRMNRADGTVLDEETFQEAVDRAMARYAATGSKWSLGNILGRVFRIKPDCDGDRSVRIEFLGVWDTVAALGFPQVWLLDDIVNFFRRHQFYNYEPQLVVNNVFQALAIDDERRTFWPKVWDETAFKGKTIEQVWFAGMHSGVGGGYSRAGLANITLDWMVARINGHRKSVETTGPAGTKQRGLFLEREFEDTTHDDANPYGKMYDSRAGLALYYRYQPRVIEGLCRDKLSGDGRIRIHQSVMERLQARTAGYAPGRLPSKFDVVSSRDMATPKDPILKSHVLDTIDLKPDTEQPLRSVWRKTRARIDGLVSCRRALYWWFLALSLFVVCVAFILWNSEIEYAGLGQAWRDASTQNWALGHVADVLHYFLPDFFNNIVTFGVLKQPAWGLGLLLLLAVSYVLRHWLRKRSDEACDDARKLVLREWDK